MPRRYSRKAEAGRLLEEGIRLKASGDEEGALAAYAQATRLRRDWATPWYNAGLIHKYRGAWRESFEANRRAHRLDPSEPAATWNLGIAATALGEWDVARSAWRRYGIPVGEGSGPIDYFIGTTPVRVSLDESPEVVWTDRIDPARAIIRSVPLPATGRRCGDVVLHDGAPMGYRMLGQREVPVFNELAVLQPSSCATFEVHVGGLSDQDVEELTTAAEGQGITIENWAANIRVLCKACSEGRPHGDEGHDHGPASNGDEGTQRLGVAASSESRLSDFLAGWRARRPDVRIEDLRCVLPAGHLREVGKP